MTIINSVVPFVAIIVVLVVVHELGHFITAKLAGVGVQEFGLGYPPRLWAKKLGDTEYSINALPLGGFVRMVGEEDPSDPRSLASRPRPVRLVVLSAGSFMNFIFAIALFAGGLMIPREVPAGRAVIQEVMPGSPAEQAGLQQGDIIWKINNREVRNVPEAGNAIRLHLGETITMHGQAPGRVPGPAGEGALGSARHSPRRSARGGCRERREAVGLERCQRKGRSRHQDRRWSRDGNSRSGRGPTP